MKAPLKLTVAPVSQAPVTVCAVVLVNVPLTGVMIVGALGTPVSIVKLILVAEDIFPAGSV